MSRQREQQSFGVMYSGCGHVIEHPCESVGSVLLDLNGVCPHCERVKSPTDVQRSFGQLRAVLDGREVNNACAQVHIVNH